MLPVTCDLVYTAHEKQLFRLIEANNGINMQIPLKGFQIDRALAQPHLSRFISQSLKDVVCMPRPRPPFRLRPVPVAAPGFGRSC